MRMKIAMGFVHTMIVMKILVLSCALHISKFCVVLATPSHTLVSGHSQAYKWMRAGG